MTHLNSLWLWWLAILVITISVVMLGILWSKLKPLSSSSPLPPGPRSLPVVGYLPFLGPDLHKQFTNMANTYGPIFKFHMGSKLHVVINTSELTKVVTRDQDHTFANRNLTIAASIITYGGQDIVFSNNSHWRKLRKIFVHEALSNKNLAACSYFRSNEVRKTIKNVFGKLGTSIDIRQVSFLTESNVLTSMILGNTSTVGSRHLGEELHIVSTNISEIFGRPNMSDFFPKLAWFDLQGVERDMKKQLKMMDEIIESMIEQRTKLNSKMSHDEVCDHEEKKDFSQILLELKNQEDGSPLDITHIKALLLDVMIVGAETTATLIEWVMTEIMKNLDVMKRVQEELEEIVGLNNIVEEYHLQKLQYLDATIKETLRLHPILPFLMPRSPSKDCTVGGYTVPKDSTVLLNVWSIHQDPRHWDNPLEFNPDRFLTYHEAKKSYNGNNLNFFPFGSGRRLCPGLPLAEKMLLFILASLLHSLTGVCPRAKSMTFLKNLVLHSRN
ncbi:putative cytochrome P450 [Helianthus annuus]|uniref:Cytochrome P450 n=1 Tax=Helianthus annuus TaxID=4232 RepID=A0A9K3JDD3_HELAN|nr:putative cytochrome P450 [Helianthus annuus]KAJ0799759.1 putative cytochrome P450 [Helianthus annuus]